MQRIDHTTAVATIPTPAAVGTPGFFTKGNPATSTPATRVSADWLNQLQEELMYVIEQAGITPSKTTPTQLKSAIDAMIAAVIVPAVEGVFNGYVSITTTPSSILAGNIGKLHIASGSASALNLCAASAVGTGDAFYFTNYCSGDVTLNRAGSDTLLTRTGAVTSIVLPPGASITVIRISSTQFAAIGTIKYASAAQSYSAVNTTYSFNHGLGMVPDSYKAIITCTAPDNSWGVGDSQEIQRIVHPAYLTPCVVVWADSTSVYVKVFADGIRIADKSSGANVAATPGSWSIKVFANT